MPTNIAQANIESPKKNVECIDIQTLTQDRENDTRQKLEKKHTNTHSNSSIQAAHFFYLYSMADSHTNTHTKNEGFKEKRRVEKKIPQKDVRVQINAL